MRSRLHSFFAQSLFSLSFALLPSLAFAGPTPATVALALQVNCGSEDDGEVSGTLRATIDPMYFDGNIGILSHNRMVRINAHAENFTTVGGFNAGYVQLCAYNTDYNVPITCSGADEVLFRYHPGLGARIDLFSLGHMDPEGINCYVRLIPDVTRAP